MQDKRIEIVEGVWSVIAQQGIAAVSVRSVAAAAGVSPGRVQHYFATKTELVRASVEAMLDAAAEANPEALGDPADPATLRALLTHAIEPRARPGTRRRRRRGGALSARAGRRGGRQRAGARVDPACRGGHSIGFPWLV